MRSATWNLTLLSLRLLRRDWRSGHLNLLLIALLVAVTTHNTIGFHSERIEKAMQVQASNLMGGDLVVRSPVAEPTLSASNVAPETIRNAVAIEFSSVVMAGDAMQLSSIKAVSENYPLKTPLKVADQPFAPDQKIEHGPAAGKAWLEARLLNILAVQVGDMVEVGDVELVVEKVLTFEPDRGGNFYSFVPRLMMSNQDLHKANLIQTGSRVEYYYQFAGPAQAIAKLQAKVEPELKPGQSILSIHSRQRTVSAALNRAQGYLQLASLMAILLASVALAMGAQFFSEMRFDTAALLRCFGLRSKEILYVFCIQLIALALISGICGGTLGWGLHFTLMELLADLLPKNIPLPSAKPFFSGTMLALVILLGFSLPALVQLQRTSPLRVLRRDLSPAPLSRGLLYVVVLSLIAILMFWYTHDLALIAAIIGGSLVAWLVTYALTWLFTKLINVIGKHSSLSVQAGLRNLSRRQMSTRVQLLGFGLTGMAMLIVLLVRGELIDKWQQQLPEQAPNHFVMNVLPHQVSDFESYLDANNVIAQPLYPIVRGRLTHINDRPVIEVVSKENDNENIPEAINRELSLSWAKDLPSDNHIVAGQWWDALTPSTHTTANHKLISIEQRLATQLNIGIGDQLGFFVANQTFHATVSSIRTVKWESFQPNFYIMFNPGGLDDLPTTFLTSFYLNEEQKSLLKPLVQQFPSITLLEVDVILKQVRTILDQVSAAVEFILLFVLSSGLTITLATLITTMPQRYREGAIMRTLGATRRQLVIQQWSEFFAIGALSGLVACFGAEIARFAIYLKLLSLPYTPSLWIWIIVPPTLGLLIGLAGQISSNRILKQSPVAALRE